MRIAFIINDKNKRLAKVIHQLKGHCNEKQLNEAAFYTTQHPKHAITLASQAAENDFDCLVAVGGDGTLHEVINGVMQSKIAAVDYPIIGLLPYGSANDFARTVGISNSLEEFFSCIESQYTLPVDLGKITLDQTDEIRYFINITGMGLGAEVVQRLEGTSSWFGPGFNYFRQILRGFLSYNKKLISCTAEDWSWEGKLLQMAVANGRYFGNGICISPDAQIDDGEFQVAIFGNLGIWDYLKNLGNLKKGIKISHPEVFYYKTRELHIESKEACGIEADGEYLGQAPVTISVLPKVIRLIVPSDI